jgi:hypothetical protein
MAYIFAVSKAFIQLKFIALPTYVLATMSIVTVTVKEHSLNNRLIVPA